MSEVEAVTREPEFAAFVGIDWADKKHAWCLRAVGLEKRESGELDTAIPYRAWDRAVESFSLPYSFSTAQWAK